VTVPGTARHWTSPGSGWFYTPCARSVGMAGGPRAAWRYARGRGLSGLADRLKKAAVRATFDVCERLGWHVIPVHFYEPIPDTRRLDDDTFERTSSLPGVDMNAETQLDVLDRLADYREEYEALPRTAEAADPGEFYVENGFYEAVDGESLYAMLRHLDPDRVLEVGGGFSTRLTATALAENDGDAELVVVEPYPDDELRSHPGVDRLLEREVQDVPLGEFAALAPDDVLFLDSSHVLAIGSDVRYEYLEVLPRLEEGVVVHVHDVFLPGEYPREWVEDFHLFWNEQYLLQAFLAFNDAFEVLFCGSYLDHHHPDRLRAAFDTYDDSVRPHSFWMRRHPRPGTGQREGEDTDREADAT